MTWADRQGIPTGVVGEVHNGIPIVDDNRATVFERRKEGINALKEFMQKSYTSKGVNAVLFGVINGKQEPMYAVYVEPGFLIELGDE